MRRSTAAKVVEVDFRGQRVLGQFAVAGGFGGAGGEVFLGGFDHGVDLRGFDTGHQRVERVQLVVGQQRSWSAPSAGDVEEGFGGFGQLRQHRQEDHQLAEQVDAQGADAWTSSCLPSCLASAQGALSAIQALAGRPGP
jgi:hypothetical protein